MSTQADEVELLTGGTDVNSAAKGVYSQNLFVRRKALEVRAGFGQIGQFDTTLTTPPSKVWDGGDPTGYGPTEILGSIAVVTDFGHTQHITLTRATACLTDCNDPNDLLPIYTLLVFDATTRQWHEEVLHVHTSDYDPATFRMDKWRGYWNTNRDAQYGSVVMSGLMGNPLVESQPNQAAQAFLCEYQDNVFFGSPDLGLWVYRPADFMGPRSQQLANVKHAEWAERASESPTCFRLVAALGQFNDAYSYLDTAGFPAPVDVCEFAGVLAIADQRNVYFSDPGQPNAIIGLNIVPVPCDLPIRGIQECNGQLAIHTDAETYIFAPGAGGLLANGELRKIANDKGCLSAQAKCRTSGAVIFVDGHGVYRWRGGFVIDEISTGLKPLFLEQLANPLSSYSRASGFSDLTAAQPRSFFDMSNTRGINCAYDKPNDLLLISIPHHNITLALQDDTWSVWSFDSLVSSPTTLVATSTNIANVFLATAADRLFAVGGIETYTPVDTTEDARGTDPVDDPSRSVYLMEWGVGGGLDRSVEIQEDNRKICGWWQYEESGQTADNEAILYIGKPVRLPNGYSWWRTPDAGVGASDYVLCLPVYLKPADANPAVSLPDKLVIQFTFDKINWGPVLVGATREVNFWLPPERIPSYEGWGLGASVVGVSEITIYNSGTGLPDLNGNQIRAYFTGATGVGVWYGKPYMNLTPNYENPLFYIAFRKRLLNQTALSQGIVPGTVTTQRNANPVKACTVAVWREGYINNRHDADDTAKPVDWVYKSQQIGIDKPNQVKARGLFLQLIQHGKGVTNAFTAWPFGLVNAVVGVDWKEWAAQIVDHTNGAIETDIKDPSLRSRFRDSASTVTTQRALNSSAAIPPKFGDTADATKGNFLVDDEQFDTVAISEDVRGEHFSWMLFGHIRDKSERLVIKSAKALVRVIAGRRRWGR